MSYSKLVKKYIPANKSNYAKGREGHKICKFTPHHVRRSDDDRTIRESLSKP